MASEGIGYGMLVMVYNDNYHNECLELLSMLLLTGNMPDFTTVQPKSSATLKVTVTPAGAGTVTVSPQKNSYSTNETVQISMTNTDHSRYTFVGWDGGSCIVMLRSGGDHILNHW